MAIKAVLFDLDGTLLPMDQDVFIKQYFGLLAKKLALHGYDPKALIDGIWAGTVAMVKNDGSVTNEDAFWNRFAALLGKDVRKDEPLFEEYYRNEFQAVKDVCGFDDAAADTVRRIRAMGLRVALATNPLFPAIATQSRIRWAGLTPEDFELYTTYENSRYCKPNPQYYLEVLAQMDLKPEECVMVGNDVSDDMVTEAMGMQVFLLTKCLINKDDADISRYRQGDFSHLLAFIDELLA